MTTKYLITPKIMDDFLEGIKSSGEYRYTLEELKSMAEANNNTVAWIHNNALYIDSEKPASRFADVAKGGGEFKVLHTASREQLMWANSGEGEFESPSYGGRTSMGHIYKVTTK